VRTRLGAACLALSLGLVCCTTSDPEPTPVRVSGRCPGEAAAITNRSLRKPGSLDVDVTGDDSSDHVFLVGTKGAPECSTFLVAETAAVILSAPVPPQEALSPGLDLPALTGAAQIDGREGLDVYLTVATGASTTFLSVFSAGSGQLKQLEIEGGTYGSLFPSGATVAHAEASDCRKGGLVISTAERESGGWAIVRRNLHLKGDRFVEKGGGITTDPIGHLFPEFRTSPFGRCPTSAP
jgi:hypothetical protein